MVTSEGSLPDVSVIVPVHNRAALLDRALDSVGRQVGGPDHELIVVDDASSDESAAVADRAGAHVIRLPTNVGPGGARNAGIAVARAAWCAFLDSDDLWSPHHLRTLWQARHGVTMVAASGVRALSTGGRVVGSPFLRPVEAGQPADLLRPENIVNTSSTMVRTEVLRELDGFPEATLSEDLDLWLRVLGQHRARVLPDLTVGNWSHPHQTSADARAMRAWLGAVLSASEAGEKMRPVVRRLDTVAWWDELRAAQRRPGAVELIARSPDLLPLLVRRFVARHRWSVPGSGGRELRRLLLEAGAG